MQISRDRAKHWRCWIITFITNRLWGRSRNGPSQNAIYGATIKGSWAGRPLELPYQAIRCRKKRIAFACLSIRAASNIWNTPTGGSARLVVPAPPTKDNPNDNLQPYLGARGLLEEIRQTKSLCFCSEVVLNVCEMRKKTEKTQVFCLETRQDANSKVKKREVSIWPLCTKHHFTCPMR